MAPSWAVSQKTIIQSSNIKFFLISTNETTSLGKRPKRGTRLLERLLTSLRRTQRGNSNKKCVVLVRDGKVFGIQIFVLLRFNTDLTNAIGRKCWKQHKLKNQLAILLVLASIGNIQVWISGVLDHATKTQIRFACAYAQPWSILNFRFPCVAFPAPSQINAGRVWS